MSEPPLVRSVSLSFAQLRCGGGRLRELGCGAFDEHRHGVGKFGAVLRPVSDAIVGDPLERQAIWLAAMKNVYLDSSFGELAQYPSAFKATLKMWLETFPDKITFGTDCFPYNDVLGAEESYWLGAESSRTALASALAEMISEGEITVGNEVRRRMETIRREPRDGSEQRHGCQKHGA